MSHVRPHRRRWAVWRTRRERTEGLPTARDLVAESRTALVVALRRRGLAAGPYGDGTYIVAAHPVTRRQRMIGVRFRHVEARLVWCWVHHGTHIDALGGLRDTERIADQVARELAGRV